jgi:FSR family fosmidomycin resistance protein-like MFS transporter
LAIFSVGGNIGAALSPVVLAEGIRWMGFRGTAVVIPLGVVGSILIWRQFRSPAAARPSAGPRDEPARTGSVPGLVAVVLAVMFRTWFQISLWTYLPSWVESHGGSLKAGGQMLSAALIATGIGSLVGGTLSDRTGRWPLMVTSLGLLAPLVWLLGTAPPTVRFLQVGAIGFLIGSTFPVAIVAAQETWPTGHGVASGLTMGLTWVGGGVGGLVTGWLADTYSLDIALTWLWLPAVLAAVCILAYPFLTRRVAPGSGGVQREEWPARDSPSP